MKKENLGSVKALKKQLGAAVAMVCVAAVALGSSTYAWFVSNNTVDATVSSISAQSNAIELELLNNPPYKWCNKEPEFDDFDDDFASLEDCMGYNDDNE